MPNDTLSDTDEDLASPQVMDEPMKKRRKTDGFTDSPSPKRDLEERSGLGGAPTRAQPQSAASEPPALPSAMEAREGERSGPGGASTRADTERRIRPARRSHRARGTRLDWVHHDESGK